MQLSPDEIIYFTLGPVSINATLVFTWGVMAFLVIGSWLITRNLTIGMDVTRRQATLEAVVQLIQGQIRDITQQQPNRYLAFIGTLYLLIATANLFTIIPGYQPPTGSLSTTAALAVCVFFAVPYFGIRQRGAGAYLRTYIEPNFFMLPFNIIAELSRTLALAIRLFGNILSGSILVAIMITIIPLFVPTILQLLGLVIGQIQAYIFAVLAAVYIASATRDL
jgi:F-type H+-transporting ATPase subunit a